MTDQNCQVPDSLSTEQAERFVLIAFRRVLDALSQSGHGTNKLVNASVIESVYHLLPVYVHEALIIATKPPKPDEPDNQTKGRVMSGPWTKEPRGRR